MAVFMPNDPLVRSRKKIVHILADGKFGGAQRSTQWLAAALDRTKYDYCFIFLYSGGPICTAISEMGYSTFVLNWINGYTVRGRWQLVSLLRRIQPALIHDHDGTPFSRVWMKLAGRCPIISTQHGSFVPRNKPLQFAFSKLDDLMTDTVVANSRFSALMYNNSYHRPCSKICVIYLGLDLNRFNLDQNTFLDNSDKIRQSEQTSGAGVRKIVFVGRLEVFKGALQIPLLAQALLKQNFSGFEILVAGDGAARDVCSCLAQELGVSQYIRFLGWQASVSEVLKQSDILIFPSLCDEAFGLVPLEALACGVPVVAYDVGGVKESLEDAPGSYLVPRGDVDAMAQAVISDLQRPTLHNPLAGFEYVQRSFNIQRTAREIEDLYTKILG
jgi:glycosyltransferase involved in cell wall biosynthesis